MICKSTVSCTITVAAIVATSIVLGCGGGAPPPVAAPESLPDPVEEEPTGQVEEAGDDVAMEGVLGSIPQHKVQRVIERNMDRLAECYGEALELLESIEGKVDLAMEVDLDGSVSEAYISGSDLGSLEAEDCMVAAVRRFRFPEPSGGRAQVSYPLVLDAPYDPPEPDIWPGSRVSEAVREHMADLESCLAGQTGISVTAYVGPGGAVITAGASANEPELYEAARCVAKAVRGWTFGDPGRMPAKVTIEL